MHHEKQYAVCNQFIERTNDQEINYPQFQEHLYDTDICVYAHLLMSYQHGIVWHLNNVDAEAKDGKLIHPIGSYHTFFRYH